MRTRQQNISVVAAKIWYLKKCMVFIRPPCIYIFSLFSDDTLFKTLFKQICVLEKLVQIYQVTPCADYLYEVKEYSSKRVSKSVST